MSESTLSAPASVYYLFQNSETTGPFSAQAIGRLMNSGTIGYATFCSTEAQSEWKSVADFPEFCDRS